MTRCISYAACHEKMVKSFKTKPPECAALRLALTGCSHRRARLAVKSRGWTISPMKNGDGGERGNRGPPPTGEIVRGEDGPMAMMVTVMCECL
jgi:hypothetical protein